MKVERFSKGRQSKTKRVRVEEGGGIQGKRTAIKDVVDVGPRTREDFYGQSFRVCDPFEWPRAGAGSLRGGSGDLGAIWEEDEPRALEKKRKRASMQGDNILGEEKRPKLVLLRAGSWCRGCHGTDLPKGLAAERRRRPRLRRVENRLRNVGERERKEDRPSWPTALRTKRVVSGVYRGRY